MISIWACGSCPKTFSRKGDLTRHTHIHTGYKPHLCRDCGKKFAQFSALNTHMNVHTKIKPFACRLDGCTAAFGDPSSCTRHRKERHQTIGAYRCPVPKCKSSIKRRSAFRHHLRKHGIDPDAVDINALAPTSLRKPQSSSLHDFKSLNATPNVLYSNSTPYPYNDVYSNASPYNLPHADPFASACWPQVQPSLMMPAIPTDGLCTISATPSPPDLDFSISPSPAASQDDLIRTPESVFQPNFISRPPSVNNLALQSSLRYSANSSPSPHSRLSPLIFSEDKSSQKKWDWDNSILFGDCFEGR